MLLPESVVVSSVKEDHQTFVIRDFLLRARLPVFIPSSTESLSSNSLSSVLTTVATGSDLVSPGTRERKVSSILLKVLEDTETMDSKSSPSAEQARSIVDFSIVALSFEGLLVLNGTLPNQRVLHAACKAAASVAQLFTRNNWTLEEKALVLLGFDPLVHVAEDDDTDPWIGLLSPHLETGIRREVLDHLIDVNLDDERTRSPMCRELQKVIWQIPEVSSE
jgi:ataxia telangiectasia mutated family protein